MICYDVKLNKANGGQILALKLKATSVTEETKVRENEGKGALPPPGIVGNIKR